MERLFQGNEGRVFRHRSLLVSRRGDGPLRRQFGNKSVTLRTLGRRQDTAPRREGTEGREKRRKQPCLLSSSLSTFSAFLRHTATTSRPSFPPTQRESQTAPTCMPFQTSLKLRGQVLIYDRPSTSLLLPFPFCVPPHRLEYKSREIYTGGIYPPKNYLPYSDITRSYTRCQRTSTRAFVSNRKISRNFLW